MKCYICKAKISEMNNIDALRKKTLDPNSFRFGLSVLHAYIRFFECLLHISYRLEIKTWKVNHLLYVHLCITHLKTNLIFRFPNRNKIR